MFKFLPVLKKKNKKAFTIAEMTVVLLILSIVMAAILPVTTNKKTSGSGGGGLWKLARNNTDIWFASPNSTQSVLMGTSQTPDANGYGRLYINIPSSSTRSQIAMMYNNSTVGYIKFKSGDNIGFGANPLPSATTGVRNLGFGTNSLTALTGGNDNVAVGISSLNAVTTGASNVGVGSYSLLKTTASNNTALGHTSLTANITGSENSAVGSNSMVSNTSGAGNTGIGYLSLGKSTSGDYNSSLGYASLYNNTTGTSNIGIGYYAGSGNTEGSNNIAIGTEAYREGAKTADNNVAIGYRALYTNAVSGGNNVGIGTGALTRLTVGTNNVLIGSGAGAFITKGSNNTGIGANSLSGLTEGSTNMGFGQNACGSVTTGSNKICIGTRSGFSSAASVYPNGFSTTDNTPQVVLGSGMNNGAGDVFLHASRVQVRTGSNDNNDATFNVYGSASTTTTLSVGTSASVSTYETIGTYLTVGTYANIGSYATVPNLYVQNVKSSSAATALTSATSVFGTLYGNWVPNSDKRLKNIEGFANIGLEEVKKLDVYKYTYKGSPDKQKIGLIAQDVEKVIPFAVQKGDDGYLGLVQDNIIYTMFNAIKDLDKLYENLKSKCQDYVVRLTFAENKINALTEVNKELSKRIDLLEKRVDKLEKDFEKLEKQQCK